MQLKFFNAHFDDIFKIHFQIRIKVLHRETIKILVYLKFFQVLSTLVSSMFFFLIFKKLLESLKVCGCYV